MGRNVIKKMGRNMGCFLLEKYGVKDGVSTIEKDGVKSGVLKTWGAQKNMGWNVIKKDGVEHGVLYHSIRWGETWDGFSAERWG